MADVGDGAADCGGGIAVRLARRLAAAITFDAGATCLVKEVLLSKLFLPPFDLQLLSFLGCRF